MCWLELAVALIFAGYCGYMRHIDKRKNGDLELENTRLTEQVKSLNDEILIDGIQRKSNELKPNVGQDIRYD